MNQKLEKIRDALWARKVDVENIKLKSKAEIYWKEGWNSAEPTSGRMRGEILELIEMFCNIHDRKMIEEELKKMDEVKDEN